MPVPEMALQEKTPLFQVRALLPPEQLDGMAAWLASGLVKGVGRELAARIVAHFGDGTRAVLEGDPARLMEAPGIGKTRLSEELSVYARLRGAQVLLAAPLSTGVSVGLRL